MLIALDSRQSGQGSIPSRDTTLCSWASHLNLIVPLLTQVYKWVLVNSMLGSDPAVDWHPIQAGVEIL